MNQDIIDAVHEYQQAAFHACAGPESRAAFLAACVALEIGRAQTDALHELASEISDVGTALSGKS